MTTTDNLIYDEDAWPVLEVQDLWVYDKLILSKYLGYLCGPAGVPVPVPGDYIVKPITNIMGMGTGTYFKHIHKSTDDLPPGTFWMEVFRGEHLSVDVIKGKVELIYQGITRSTTRFSRWTKIDKELRIPQFIIDLSNKYGVVNLECINGNIIEMHIRSNPDWVKYKAKELIPVWNPKEIDYNRFVEDRDRERLGFNVYK